MSPKIARQVMAYFAPPPISSFKELSNRENQVLEHLADGLLYKEIADKLGTKLDTVRTQVASIYRKLHVHTRADAVRQYLGQKPLLPYHIKM
jgi:DNA-binding NarL/FixJ family response regulator